MKTKFIILLILLLAFCLRIFRLDSIPRSLYSDEINQGYNAYSILHTGKDEHGLHLPFFLRSFGDWKPPLQTYLMIPFVKTIGLNEWSVRLPNALLGIISTGVTYILVYELFKNSKKSKTLSLLSAFFISVSPWHLLQSRAAMLVMVAFVFYQLGFYLYLKTSHKLEYIIPSIIFFMFSVYAYYGMRLIIPLTILVIFFIRLRVLIYNPKVLIISIFSGIVIIIPLLVNFIKVPDVVFGRAKTVSVFYDKGIGLRQWELITQDGINADTLLTRFYHNGYYLYSKDIIKRFTSHLESNFLFLEGDKSQPFQIPGMGILYLSDLFFIPAGFLIFIINKEKPRLLLILWLVFSILPASLTFMTPSSNRTFNMVFPMVVFSSLGIIMFKEISTSKKLLLIPVLLAYVFNIHFFLDKYFIVLNEKHPDWWNYGWKEVVLYTKTQLPNYDNIIVSDSGGMPYIYFLFYMHYDPGKFQKEALRTYQPDEFGFEYVEGFGKFIFIKDKKWSDLKDSKIRNSLYIIPQKLADNQQDVKKTFYYPDGKPFVKLY